MRTLTCLVLALATAACGGVGGDDPDERLSEIRAARDAYDAAATDLGTAARTVAEEVAQLRTTEAEPAQRLDTITEVREELLPQLEEAIASPVDAPTEGPDVRDAAIAWNDATRAAEQLVNATEVAVDHAQVLAEADRDLAAVVEGWSERGSHSEQLERFGQLRMRAEAVLEQLQGRDELPACSREVDARVTAARHVASATGELRDLIDQRRGEDFDERLGELQADPYGGERLTGTTSECWAESDVTAFAELVGDELERIESALNPQDLGG